MEITLDQQLFPHILGKIICVGRNYPAHAKELNNPIPTSPILFIKPASSAVPFAPNFSIPQQQGRVHHELEIAILISKALCHADTEEVTKSIAGIGLGLDLTLRDIQDQLKEKGHPWERAKSFDGACPLTGFVSVSAVSFLDWYALELMLIKNGEMRQQGSSANMLFPILPLIAHISKHFSLQPGDVILTGTPAGVGPLSVGDSLSCKLSLGHSVLLTQDTMVL